MTYRVFDAHQDTIRALLLIKMHIDIDIKIRPLSFTFSKPNLNLYT